MATFEAFVKALEINMNGEVKEITRSTGEVYTGLIVGEGNIRPTINLDGLYKDTNGNVGEALEYIEQTLKKDHFFKGDPSIIMKSYETAKEYITMRLVAKKNIPNKAIYIPYFDMRIIFAAVFYIDEDQWGAVIINESLAETWGVTAKQLLEGAEETTPKLLEAKVLSIAEILGMPLDIASPFDVLTNTNKMFGAATILYEGMLEQIAETKGSNFYIIPSSVHEVLILPYDDFISKADLINTIGLVNNDVIEPNQFLSNSLFYYDRKAKEVRIAS